MLKKRCILLLLLSIYSFANAQSFKHPSTLGMHFILNDFKNNYPSLHYKDMDAGLALTYLKGISPRFNWKARIGCSFPDSISTHSTISSEKSLFLQGDVALQLQLIKKNHWIHPYLQTGVGGTHFRSGYGVYTSIGTGLEINYKDVYWVVSAQYHLSLASTLNNHFSYGIGIEGLLSKVKKKKQVFQPKRENILLPKDRDGDGILDSVDACPIQPGLALFQGCPDKDGDGLPDREDQCPDVFGYKKYQGCPVPDRDGDGINEDMDSCVTIPGVQVNHGCPLMASSEKEKIEAVARNIFFNTNSYKLLPVSFEALDKLVLILKEHPAITLIIEGHTDNSGTLLRNQQLSENRAKAVMGYLVANGIDKNRLQAVGYGQCRPIAENTTIEGKSRNRRVELKIQENR